MTYTINGELIEEINVWIEDQVLEELAAEILGMNIGDEMPIYGGIDEEFILRRES